MAAEHNEQARLESRRARLQEKISWFNPLSWADPTFWQSFQDTPLHQAVEANDAASVRRCLDSKIYDINALDSTGRSALCIAVEHGRAEITSLLLEAGAKTDVPDALDKYTPIQLAAAKGYAEIVDILLHAKADPNTKTYFGCTPLHLAADKGNTSTVALLLKAGAQVNAKFKYSEFSRDEERKYIATPLHLAVEKGHSDIVTMLLAAGAEVNTPRPVIRQNHNYPEEIFDEYALYIATAKGDEEIVKQLLAAGADTNKTTKENTSLDEAAKLGRTSIAALLLAADYNLQNCHEAINTAFVYHKPETAAVLLAMLPEAERRIAYAHGHALGAIPATRNILIAAEYIISKKGLELLAMETQRSSQKPASSSAAYRSFGAQLNFEKNLFAEISSHLRTQDGQRHQDPAAQRCATIITSTRECIALHQDFYRAIKHDLDIAARLLILDPNAANAQNHEGKTPLIRAIEEQHTIALQRLLDRKADIHLPGRTGESALQIAGKNYPAAACLMIKSITTPQSFLTALKTLSSPLIAAEIYDALHTKGRELGMFEKHKGWLTTGFKYPTVVDFFAAALEASTPEDSAPNPTATARETALAAVRSAQKRQLTRGTLWSSRVTESDEEAQEEKEEKQPILPPSNQRTPSALRPVREQRTQQGRY